MSSLIELLAEEVMAQESKWWNVLVPVVAVLRADSMEAAISLLRQRLDLAGFSPYESEKYPFDAFESEDPDYRTGDSPDRGGDLPPVPTVVIRNDALYQILADDLGEDAGEDTVSHDTVREQRDPDA